MGFALAATISTVLCMVCAFRLHLIFPTMRPPPAAPLSPSQERHVSFGERGQVHQVRAESPPVRGARSLPRVPGRNVCESRYVRVRVPVASVHLVPGLSGIFHGQILSLECAPDCKCNGRVSSRSAHFHERPAAVMLLFVYF